MPDLGSNGRTGQDESLELPGAQISSAYVSAAHHSPVGATQDVFGTTQAITKKSANHALAQFEGSENPHRATPGRHARSSTGAAKAVIIAEVDAAWRRGRHAANAGSASIARVIFIRLTGTPRIVRNRRKARRSFPAKGTVARPTKDESNPTPMGPGPVCQRSYGSPCRHALSLRPPTDTRRREES